MDDFDGDKADPSEDDELAEDDAVSVLSDAEEESDAPDEDWDAFEVEEHEEEDKPDEAEDDVLSLLPELSDADEESSSDKERRLRHSCVSRMSTNCWVAWEPPAAAVRRRPLAMHPGASILHKYVR